MKSLQSLLIIFAVAMPSTALHAEFTPIAGWDQQLFPSYIFATAAVKNSIGERSDTLLGESNGLLGIQIEAPSDHATIEVTIECDDFLEASTFSGTMEKAGETYSVCPKIRYKFDRLSQCNQATPATITYRVCVEEGEQQEASVTVTLRPINDCPLAIVRGDQAIDTSFTFAAFVNEQHPYTDKLLREALDIGLVDNFTGYQTKDDGEVLRQVYALWDLLVARDVRYSSITTTSADSNNVYSQNVRMLEDTVNNQQANCVDGSTLLVSLLRKIGIESSLILVPGHCYVAFFVDKEQTKCLGLETTLIGSDLEWPKEVDESLEDAIDESLQTESSWPSFVQAIQVGTTNLVKNGEQFQDASQVEYQVIDIAAARKAGVLPIPFRSKEQFVSFDHSGYIEANSYAEEDDDEEDDEEEEEEEDEEDEEDEDEE